MTHSIKVTNEDKFNLVDNVELNLEKYQNHYKGEVSVELTIDTEPTTYWGEHGSTDFEDEYGFIII